MRVEATLNHTMTYKYSFAEWESEDGEKRIEKEVEHHTADKPSAYSNLSALNIKCEEKNK